MQHTLFSSFTTVFVILFLWISSASALGSAKKPLETLNIAAVDGAKLGEIVLQFEDMHAQNLCNYVVQRFEYLSSVEALVLGIYREECFTEAFGKGQGEFRWILPSSLRGNSKTKVIINNQLVGVLKFVPGQAKKAHFEKTQPKLPIK